MADDLKRVGLIFEENGSAKFVKTLKEVNSAISDNNLEFKKAQAQWDRTTPITEKLNFQIKNLGEAIELQKEKATALRAEISKLENAEESDTKAKRKNQEQLEKKRKELERTEIKIISYTKKVESMKNELHNTGKKIEEFGTKVENTGKKIESAGKKLSAFSAATGSALVASAKSAIDFEDAFTGVEKTVDGTQEQMKKLEQGIRDMAKEIPSTTTEISAVAEAAGQLGIKTEDIISFTRVMIDLGNSTNLSAEEAASSLAKFANITNMSAKDYDKLGSTIVALGNNFATTEADIVEMATRLAATGELTGLTQSQILSLATAMSSVGIEAEAGGSAMSKLLKQIQVAVETGSDELNDFASVAGMATKEFKQAFEEDAVSALSAFISGLNDTKRNGKSAIAILEEMGLKEVRLSNTILSLANASDLMNDAVKTGNEAWEDNTALTNEANKRYDTLKSKIIMALNKLKDMAITLGNKLMPSIETVLDTLGKWIEKFESLSDEQVDMIVKIGLWITAIGPLLTIIGKLTTAIGGTARGIGTFVQAIGVARGTITSTSTAVNGLAGVFSAITSPIGIACVGIGAAIAGIAIAVQLAEKDTKEAFSNMGNAATDFITGIDTAKSYLNDFNSELFVSSEEQQKLQNQMNEVQQGITEICKTASEERRNYTQGEIRQLDEYFEKLRELNQRELEIQKSISEAISQQAVTNAETFQGSLEEYKLQSQEWIKTAEDQRDKTIDLINNQTIEETALLNQRYATEEARQTEEYKKEYERIVAQKEEKIALANEEVAKISEVYANAYLERNKQNDGFYNTLKEYIEKQEKLEEAHKETIKRIKDGELWYVTNTAQAITSENQTFAFHQKNTWNEMYKNMSEEQEKELGVWLAMVAQTELYGGKIDGETQEIVDSILETYDNMPKETRKAMKNAMKPMLEEMEKKEPSLLAKAFNIANGIINNLRKAFDIHSPSRKTRKIMKFAMEPMEEEMEEGKKELFKQADEIGEGVVNRLSGIKGNVNINGNTNIDRQYSNSSIDYQKMAEAFSKALTNCKFTLDEDGFARIVKDELYKAV